MFKMLKKVAKSIWNFLKSLCCWRSSQQEPAVEAHGVADNQLSVIPGLSDAKTSIPEATTPKIMIQIQPVETPSVNQTLQGTKLNTSRGTAKIYSTTVRKDFAPKKKSLLEQAEYHAFNIMPNTLNERLAYQKRFDTILDSLKEEKQDSSMLEARQEAVNIIASKALNQLKESYVSSVQAFAKSLEQTDFNASHQETLKQFYEIHEYLVIHLEQKSAVQMQKLWSDLCNKLAREKGIHIKLTRHGSDQIECSFSHEKLDQSQPKRKVK